MTDLQKKIFEIFKDVITICSRNGINYFAIGGTCIGAVRHNGFIPWDDDIDIAIPIEQYEKFKQCMKSQLPENLYLYDCNEVKEYRQLFCKVCDRNTAFIEETEKDYPAAYKGVFVDIMPLSGVPSDKVKQTKFIRQLRIYEVLNFVNRYPFCEMTTWKIKLLWITLYVFGRKKLFSRFSDKSIMLLRKYPLCDSEYTGYVWSTNLERLIFPKAYFDDYVEFPFEDTKIRCPVGYDGYLTQQFGEYMKLPPEEQRIKHHSYIVDLKHSYKEYENKRW